MSDCKLTDDLEMIAYGNPEKRERFLKVVKNLFPEYFQPSLQPKSEEKKETYCAECGEPLLDEITMRVHIAIHNMKIDKPTHSPEKCDCNDRELHRPGTCPAGRLGKDKPDSAVEKYIDRIRREINGCCYHETLPCDWKGLGDELRELVRLARAEGGE